MEAAKAGEIIIEAHGVSEGVAIGKAVLLHAKSSVVASTSIKKEEVEAHKNKFKEAQKKLAAELEVMARELKDSGSAGIIDTQKQIIEDVEIEKSVLSIIENDLLSVDFAIYETYCKFIELLKENGSELFRQRIVDLEDIRDRFIAQVNNQAGKSNVNIENGTVIVTRQISPTDLVSYYENGAAGLVLEKGGLTSHAAIIAKSLGIPCIVNAGKAIKKIGSGQVIIIDGDAGSVLINPSVETLDSYREKQQQAAEDDYNSIEFETSDGINFEIGANIEFEAELPKVKKHGAHSIGLLRTEGLLFGKEAKKSQAEQEAFYAKIIEEIEGTVTIRLFDIGGDKLAGRAIREANPFLGYRGVRLLLAEKELLRTQLKAILKVAGHHPGKIRVLVPMVSVLEEVRAIKEEIQAMQQTLKKSGLPIDGNLPIGVMIEVPSAAIFAEAFAKEVDFFSVGTNDLTQYTLAVDRGNERIGTLFQHYHPAVLRLIQETAKGAASAGIPVSVCGELAGDNVGAACLMGMGIHSFSMAPASIPKISKLLSSKPKADLKKMAEAALEATSAQEVKQIYADWE